MKVFLVKMYPLVCITRIVSWLNHISPAPPVDLRALIHHNSPPLKAATSMAQCINVEFEGVK